MSAKIVSDMVSRRKMLSIIGVSVAFGFLRHHERRTGRHERRHTRRTGHTALSEISSDVVAVSPSACASPGSPQRDHARDGKSKTCGWRWHVAGSVERRDHLRGLSCGAKRPFTAAKASAPCRSVRQIFPDSQRPARTRVRRQDGRRKSGAWGSAGERAMWLTRRVQASGSRLGRDDNER